MIKDELKEKAVNYLTCTVVGVILIGGSVLIYPHYRFRNALKIENLELQRQIDVKRGEIEELRDNQRRFRNDPDFIEHIARQNHRVYPGELVFMFEK